jgi:hypothetical protein
MDMTWADGLLSLGVGIGLAAAAGLRVFLPLLVLGLAARAGLVALVSSFDWLASTPGLAALTIASVVEVSAYYVPIVDNLLDLVATPLAILAGVLLTAAVTTTLPPEVRWAAAIVAGGGAAGLVQTLTSITRLKSTALTAGTANPILATLELAGSLIASLVAIMLPGLALLVVVAIVIAVRRARRSARLAR